MSIQSRVRSSGRKQGSFSLRTALLFAAAGLVAGLILVNAASDDDTKQSAAVSVPAGAAAATTSVPEGMAVTDGDGVFYVPPSPTVSAPRASVTDPGPVYIVGSQAEADLLRRGIEEANLIRAHEGLAPLDPTIFVAATDAEAESLIAGTVEANKIRAEQGAPEIPVTDLRPH